MTSKPTYEELEKRVKELEQAEFEGKRVEEVLKHERDYLKNIFASVEDGIYILDQQYDIHYANPVLVKDFGNYEGRKCYNYFHNRDEVCPWCKNEDVWAGKTVRWEWYFKKNERTYYLIDTPITLPDGSMGKLEIFQDISDRKRMEKKIKLNEARFRELFNNMSSGVAIYEAKDNGNNFIFKDFNRAGEQIEKIKKENLIDKSVLEIFPGVREFGLFDVFKRVWKTGKPEHYPISIYKDKRVMGWRKNYIFKLPSGEIVTVYDDVTEQKQVEEEKTRLEEQLQQAQKMEAIGTLAGGVAHDFNNILTAIIGNANLALLDISNDDSLREQIEEIKKAGNKAASLTRQLLTFSRKQVIKPKVLDFNEVINETEKMLRRMIGEDIEFQTILSPRLWKVHMDSGQVDQIIMNIAVNARDAMPQGGKLVVETANVYLDENYLREHSIEGTPGHYVMLAITDNGSGMDKETQEHIFEPFFTTKEIGKGTGLGLSTVYGIAKQNNGFIWVYSEPGQGTTFKIYLPKVKEGAEAEEKEQTPVLELGGSETVLIVEDDDGLRKVAVTVLKQRGYKVLEAENGEDALRVSEAHDGSIDLLIPDVVMPKIGGKETAERLQPLYLQMKVIYMSGYTDNAIVHHGVLVPGLNFLEKPFSPEGLARKVREVLDIE